MGNVNEPANEKGPNAVKVSGLLPDNQEHSMLDSVNLDSDGLLPSSSSSTQHETSSVDLTRLSSPVLSVVIADANDIQSSLDRTFDASTQSSNTSLSISESALPATFDISAEIAFSNPGELSDYFVAPSLTHLGTADRITLSDMHVTTQSEQSLDPSSTFLPIFPERDALGSDCTSAMSLGSDALAANQPLVNHEAKHYIGTDAGVSHPPDRVPDLSFASLATSAVHVITSVAMHKEILTMQPSEITAETMNSASFYAAKHASHRPPRENLAPIDNVVSVIADAVPTKPISQKSGTYTDKNAILASIPLAATYAEAANLAARHPEFAKELLSRPLLTPSQLRAPAVPSINYTVPDSTAQGARPKDHRRTRRGARNDRNHSQSLSRPTHESEYIQDEHAGGRSNVLPDDRRGQLNLPHLDREPLRWQDSSQPRAHAQAVTHEPKHYYASRELSDADASHDPFTLSQVPSHEVNVLDRLNAIEWAPSHDPWLSENQLQDNSHDRAVREQLAIPGETRHVNGSDVADEWVHSHDPWISGNKPQSSSHIHAVSDTIRNKDTSPQRCNPDEWRPVLGPSISENVCTKSDRLPGSQSPVFHNTASETYAPDATADKWQAPHDPLLIEQPVIGDMISISRQYPPSVVPQEYLAHIHSQPTASILSQPNRKVDASSPDLYRIVRQQQVAGITLAAQRHLRNEPESEGWVLSADAGSGRQMEPRSAPPGEPRSASSPPHIVALFNNERSCNMSGWHSNERDKAVAAMVSTRILNTEQSNASSLASFRGPDSHDVPSRDLHLCANNVDLVSERNPRLSGTIPMESRNSALNLRVSHAATRRDVSWLECDTTRDATLWPVNPPHSNSIACLPSIPLASISQNDLAPHVLQYPNSSNFYSNAETTVHLQRRFDSRADGWHANPGGKERGQINGLYDTCPDPRHSLPARAKINSSLHASGPREMHQQCYEPEVIDSRKEQRLTDADHYGYGMPRGGSDGISPRQIYNRRKPTEKGHGNTYESINWRRH